MRQELLFRFQPEPVRLHLLQQIVAGDSHLRVHPVHEPDHPEDWNTYIERWLEAHELTGDLAVLTEGPSTKHPEANHRMEIIELGRQQGK